MERIPISDSELEVMKVLWDKAPRTLPQVVEAVRRVNPWESVTVKTLLNRLVRKQAVRQEGERRSYLYSPEITREEYRREQAGKERMERQCGQRFEIHRQNRRQHGSEAQEDQGPAEAAEFHPAEGAEL